MHCNIPTILGLLLTKAFSGNILKEAPTCRVDKLLEYSHEITMTWIRKDDVAVVSSRRPAEPQLRLLCSCLNHRNEVENQRKLSQKTKVLFLRISSVPNCLKQDSAKFFENHGQFGQNYFQIWPQFSHFFSKF